MALFHELNELMVKYRFRPNRKLSQLFLVDSEAIQKIIQIADLKKTDIVLEIGSGTGFLTRELQKKCKVIAVELDDSLFRLLENELPKENLELLHGNFLDLKIPFFTKLVSLPPYAISSEIMYKLFELGFESAVLVFQSEFAERISAEPGFFDYNTLSVLTQYFCEIQVCGQIPAKAFFPKPQAISKIIKLTRKKRKKTVLNTIAFKKFIQSLFRFKNKNLSNSLENSFQFIENDLKINKKEFEKRIKKLHLKDVKVNLISCEEFVEIFNSFYCQ